MVFLLARDGNNGCELSSVDLHLNCCAGTGGGLDTEGRWAMPDIVVSIRKAGEEPQIGVVRDALMVCLAFSPA